MSGPNGFPSLLQRPLNLCGAAGLVLLTALSCSAHSAPSPAASPEEKPTEAGDSSLEPTSVVTESAKPDAQQVVLATDRTQKDRSLDERRKPIRMLEFFEVGLGDRVADLGAGSGYTTELLARAVGRSGVIYSQNDRKTMSQHIEETWLERLRRDVLKNVIPMKSTLEDPFVDEAQHLDLVTFLFSYHDAIANHVDRRQLNRAVYQALKPGRLYIIADHEAPPGSGLGAASTLHRIEASIVRREVEQAGFQFVESSDFLRVEQDDERKPSPAVGFKTNRYVLKFKRPD